MLRLILFVVLLMLQISASAVTTSPATLTQLLSTIQTMQADFTQTLSDNKGKLTEQSVGHMALQRPGKFRWEVTKPLAQLIVANNIRLWIYDPGLEQVTIRLLHKEVGDTPAMLLSDPTIAIEKNFKIHTIKNVSALQWFALVPKNHDNILASIKMAFSHGQIREIDLQDQLGHNTAIEFYNVVLNHSLPPSLFYFTPPAHVDVIDETKHS